MILKNLKRMSFRFSNAFPLVKDDCDIVYYDVMIFYLIHFIFFVRQHYKMRFLTKHMQPNVDKRKGKVIFFE